jgi:hypothetical protein
MRAFIAMIAVIGALAAAGCGETEDDDRQGITGGDNSGTQNSGTQAEARIYDIVHWTLNESGCDAEGDSVLSQNDELLAVVACEDAYVGSYLLAEPCADEDSCNDVTCQAFGWVFESGSDESGWEGASVSSGFGPQDGECLDPEYSPRTLELDGDNLRLESRTHIGDSYPADDGFCTTDRGKASAEGAPCSSYEVLEAEQY